MLEIKCKSVQYANGEQIMYHFTLYAMEKVLPVSILFRAPDKKG